MVGTKDGEDKREDEGRKGESVWQERRNQNTGVSACIAVHQVTGSGAILSVREYRPFPLEA